jgi:hypothetical protein
MIQAFKGKADVYSIQWSERGPPQEQAPVLDEAKWKARLQQLGPIRICYFVPGSRPSGQRAWRLRRARTRQGRLC